MASDRRRVRVRSPKKGIVHYYDAAALRRRCSYCGEARAVAQGRDKRDEWSYVCPGCIETLRLQPRGEPVEASRASGTCPLCGGPHSQTWHM
jgi:rubrerythrin